MRRYLIGLKRVVEFEDVFTFDADNEEDAMDMAEEMAGDLIDTDRPPVGTEVQVISCEEIPWEVD
jgi:hypothetical protein